MTRIAALCALLFFFCIRAAHAQWLELYWADPALSWRTLQTEHFDIHFADKDRDAARLVAGIAERAYLRTTRLLDWQPRRRTQVVLFDSGDFSNGFASPVPYNFSGIFLSPPDQGELLQNRDCPGPSSAPSSFTSWPSIKRTAPRSHLPAALGGRRFAFPNALRP